MMLTGETINCLQKVFLLTQIVMINLFFASVTTSDLLANLDGFTTPIFVSNTYTFTNGERADGFVTFLNGFDLPINGTVTLNLMPGCMIDGNITMNGGTLIAQSPVIVGPQKTMFLGSGYLNIPLLVTTKSISITGTIRCLGKNMIIKGMGFSKLDIQQGVLDCAGLSDSILLDNIQVSGFNNIVTQTLAPRHFNLSNSQFTIGDETATIFSPYIKATGECQIGTGKNGRLVCPGVISIDTGSQLTLSSPSTLQLGGLLMQDAESQFVLDNATLDFNNTNSPGAQLSFTNTFSNTGGRLVVFGKSSLISSGLHSLLIPPSISLVIESGSRLELRSPLHLVVY